MQTSVCPGDSPAVADHSGSKSLPGESPNTKLQGHSLRASLKQTSHFRSVGWTLGAE